MASFDFTIPEHFAGLLIQSFTRSESTAVIDNLAIQFGSTGAAIDTSSNYDFGLFQGNGTVVSATVGNSTTFVPGGAIPGSTGPATNFGRGSVWVPNYYSTQARKGITGTSNCHDATTSSSAFRNTVLGGAWNSTAPIGKVRAFVLSGANFSLGSTVRVYGLP